MYIFVMYSLLWLHLYISLQLLVLPCHVQKVIYPGWSPYVCMPPHLPPPHWLPGRLWTH